MQKFISKSLCKRLIYYGTVVGFSSVIATTACSDDIPEIVDDAADTGTDSLQDVDETADSTDTSSDDKPETDTSGDDDIPQPRDEVDREECLADEEFEFPSEIRDNPEERIWQDHEFATPYTAGNSIRASMRPPAIVGEPRHFWLEEGDPLIRDVNRWSYGYEWLPRKFKLFILHEGEPLPFKLEEVDWAFPSIERIESWDEDDYSKSAVVELEDQSTLSYSWVIPPWAFEEKGSYNLRIAALPIWEEGEEWGAPWFSTPSVFESLGFFHVHYGSECPLPDQRDIPVREMNDDVKLWDTWDATAFIHWFELFLAPPVELFDWGHIPEVSNHQDEIELNQVFEFSEPEVTLNLYVGNSSGIYSWETLYLVMRDGEIIDEFLLEDLPETDVDDYYGEPDSDNRGAMIPIDFELTEETATYRVVAIRQPFDEYDREKSVESLEENDGTVVPPTFVRHFEARQSLALQMKYVPQ